LVRDPAGKTRIVAIFDYWTQTALKPFHSFLIKKLAVWFGETDRTMDQIGFDTSRLSGPYYSFDLSQATDRFPMEFQKEIVSHLIGEKLGLVWTRLLVGHPFAPSWQKGTEIYFGAGQPMGAYTSWAVFALCHH
jgi:hypothetical protein